MTRDSSTEGWIEPSLDADPSEAQLAHYGTPVWALIAYLPAVDNDIGRAAADYGVPKAAFEAAVDYYRANRGAIDARIAANAA